MCVSGAAAVVKPTAFNAFQIFFLLPSKLSHMQIYPVTWHERDREQVARLGWQPDLLVQLLARSSGGPTLALFVSL